MCTRYDLPLPFGLKGIDTLGLKRLPGTRAAGGTTTQLSPSDSDDVLGKRLAREEDDHGLPRCRRSSIREHNAGRCVSFPRPTGALCGFIQYGGLFYTQVNFETAKVGCVIGCSLFVGTGGNRERGIETTFGQQLQEFGRDQTKNFAQNLRRDPRVRRILPKQTELRATGEVQQQ